MTACRILYYVLVINQTGKKSKQSTLGRQDIGGVCHKRKGTSRNVNGKCLTDTVQNIGPDKASVESSWCAGVLHSGPSP